MSFHDLLLFPSPFLYATILTRILIIGNKNCPFCADKKATALTRLSQGESYVTSVDQHKYSDRK